MIYNIHIYIPAHTQVAKNRDEKSNPGLNRRQKNQ